MKTCIKCGCNKPLTDFSKNKSKKDKLQVWCKICNNKHNVNKQRLKNTGCSVENFNSLFKQQHGRCAICNTHSSELNQSLCVDHCHTTNKIRGLLCHTCNLSLGGFKDNQRLLLEAIVYLKRSQ